MAALNGGSGFEHSTVREAAAAADFRRLLSNMEKGGLARLEAQWRLSGPGGASSPRLPPPLGRNPAAIPRV